MLCELLSGQQEQTVAVKVCKVWVSARKQGRKDGQLMFLV